jgi:hypothetical protein
MPHQVDPVEWFKKSLIRLDNGSSAAGRVQFKRPTWLPFVALVGMDLVSPEKGAGIRCI